MNNNLIDELPRKVQLDPDYRGPIKDGLRYVLCCRCQKVIKTRNFRMAFTNGIEVIHPDDTHLMADWGDAWQPIGNDCAKAIGVHFTHLSEIGT